MGTYKAHISLTRDSALTERSHALPPAVHSSLPSPLAAFPAHPRMHPAPRHTTKPRCIAQAIKHHFLPLLTAVSARLHRDFGCRWRFLIHSCVGTRKGREKSLSTGATGVHGQPSILKHHVAAEERVLSVAGDTWSRREADQEGSVRRQEGLSGRRSRVLARAMHLHWPRGRGALPQPSQGIEPCRSSVRPRAGNHPDSV